MIQTTFNKVSMFSKDTFVGRIKVYENGQYLWSKSAGVHRISREDALDDARRLKEELEELIYQDRYEQC